jgi:transcriptional regulator with XRE-family HTH domain
MYDCKEVGKRIIKKRQEKGFKTQTSFAEKALINSATMSKYETGNSFMTLDHLLTICSILECSTDELLFGNNNNVTIKKENPSLGRSIAEAIVSLVDYKVLTSRPSNIDSPFFPNIDDDPTLNFALYLFRAFPKVIQFYQAYYKSVEDLAIKDRSKIAKALIETYSSTIEDDICDYLY